MLPAALFLALLPQEAPTGDTPETTDDRARLFAAGELAGLTFTQAEIELMLPDVLGRLRDYEALRARSLPNAVPPALRFLPAGWPETPLAENEVRLPLPEPPARPADLEQLAFADIPTLAALIKAKRVSCLELTDLFLARLERLDRTLHCVITLLPERARAQARALDEELADGRWRGPLHGIPWGAKDLLAVAGAPTTWGAAPYRQQVLDLDAAAVERLDRAGAVLIAKLTLGALAWGDVWFGGKTRNPWKPDQGSSGSSAGPASAVAAGGVTFAIGSETLGSIVSPSDRCGATSLRPTFGAVSRHGAMALSWSMDKLGPLCRSFTDAAIVMGAITGYDPRDADSVPSSFRLAPGSLDPRALRQPGTLRIGFVESDMEASEAHLAVLEVLEGLATDELAVELVPIDLPDYPVGAMRLVLSAEAACAFAELTESGRDDELVRQERFAWPNSFRAARLIPAVEYLRANRLRTLLIRDVEAALAPVDVLVHPSFTGNKLTLFNLTGHPTAVAPCGFRDDGTPFSVSFTGKLFDDARVLAVADAWQRATAFHLRHPKL